ncbi:MAG: leucyl aminopeptidase family protein, partial [Stenotrophomonas sp.]|nr:leucyl aminopeptidase family protein [Stenotrophomonas sp.]
MTEITGFVATSDQALPLHVLDRAQFKAWNAAQPPALQAWLQAQNFTASGHSVVLLPGEHGIAGAVIGIGDAGDAYS